MNRINIISLKGGVGKSLIAFQLAKKLSINRKVALIDRSFSKTISNFFGIKDEFPSGVYWKDVGGIRIVDLSCSTSFMSLEREKIVEEYRKYKDFDIIIVDNPPLPSDQCFEMDLTSWILATNEYVYKAIPILAPPDEIIDYTMRIMLPINDFLSDLLKKNFNIKTSSRLFNPLAIIVNQVKSGYQINYDNIRKYFRDTFIFTIPFKKEVLIKHFDTDLTELDPFVEYIRSYI
ncbi:ParA family protein [Sulfurisphaera javensis]|uniref:ParA family protein n=1 Tax=Sulfurisphaera javensis TaxID=2049879 RepID=A0AAT9GPK3_9CREN